MPKKQARKRGPKPDRLVIEGDWKEAIGKALRSKPPEGGLAEACTEEAKEGARALEPARAHRHVVLHR